MEAKRNWLTIYIPLIIIVLVIAAFTVLYFQLSSRINDNDDAVTALTNQTTSLQTQISSINSQVTSINEGLASGNSKISSFGNQLLEVNTQINDFTQQFEQFSADITDLQGKSNTSGAQLSTLQTQLSSMQNQLTSAQNTVAALQSQVNTQTSILTSLTQQISTPVTLFASRTVSVGPGTYTAVYSFVPSYTGRITISGVSNANTGFILIINNSTGGTNTYNFGRGTTFTVPLTAANSYTIYFGNQEVSGTFSATLNGVYQL